MTVDIAMGFLQSGNKPMPQADPKSTRRALTSVAMTPADVPEI